MIVMGTGRNERMRGVLLALVLAAGCCVSKQELRGNVAAWEAFTDAVEPDLRFMYEGMGEPTRTTRLRLLEDNRAAIAASNSRARGN